MYIPAFFATVLLSLLTLPSPVHNAAVGSAVEIVHPTYQTSKTVLPYVRSPAPGIHLTAMPLPSHPPISIDLTGKTTDRLLDPSRTTPYAGPPMPTADLPGSPGRVYACAGTNFTDTCQYCVEKVAECHDFPTDMWDKITSVGPDRGNKCWVFDHEQCKGNYVELRFPGTGNLRGFGFDNMIRSWECWAEPWGPGQIPWEN